MLAQEEFPIAQNENRPTRVAQRADASAQTVASEKSATIEWESAEGRNALDEIYANKRRAEGWRKRSIIDESEFVISGGLRGRK